MNLFKKLSKEKEILELKARIKNLEQFEVLSTYDYFLRGVLHFRDAESYFEYLKKKARVNIKMMELIGPYSEHSTPFILDKDLIHLASRVNEIRKEMLSELESSRMFLLKHEET